MGKTTMQRVVEQILFAAIPLTLSCVAYLLNDLHSIRVRMEEIESKAALEQAALSQTMTEKFNDDALARSELDKRISIMESTIKSLDANLQQLRNNSLRHAPANNYN